MKDDGFERAKKISKLVTGREMSKKFYDSSHKMATATKVLLDALDEIKGDEKPATIMATFTMMIAPLDVEDKKKVLFLMYSTFFDKDGLNDLSKSLEDINYLAKHIDKDGKDKK